MWTTSRGKSWTRRWRSVPPCRSRSSCRSAQNYATLVPGKKANARSSRWRSSPSRRQVPVVELNEKNGGRHQSFRDRERGFGARQTINELRADHEKVHRNNHRVAFALFTGRRTPSDARRRCRASRSGRTWRTDSNPAATTAGTVWGGSSTYTKKGNKWVFEVSISVENPTTRTISIPVAQFTAEGGYYFKILPMPEKSCSSMLGLWLLPGMNR